jgi:hypothetical protein
MTIEGWVKANPKKVVAAIFAVLIAPVPLLLLINSSGLFDDPDPALVHLSLPSPTYANTYPDVRVAVNNRGNVTAEECLVRAYSADPDDPGGTRALLAESERFDLAPQEGHVATLDISLLDTTEALVFLTECRNARSFGYGVAIDSPRSLRGRSSGTNMVGVP